jgi:hypothetical protein
MASSPSNFHLFFTNLIFVLTIALDQSSEAASTVSITAQPAFSSVRPCVQHCMFCGEYWLVNCPGSAIGLNNVLSDNGLDALYCRTDLTSTASSYLTSCIYSGCATNTVDLEDGLSLYKGYCHIDGASLDNYPTLTSTTSSSTTHPTGAVTSTKVVTVEGQSSSASNPSPTESKLSPGNTPTIVVTSTETVTSAPSSTAQRSSECPLTLTFAFAAALVYIVALLG